MCYQMNGIFLFFMFVLTTNIRKLLLFCCVTD